MEPLDFVLQCFENILPQDEVNVSTAGAAKMAAILDFTQDLKLSIEGGKPDM